MRVLIADDHAFFRRGVREVLAERFSDAVFGEASTAEAALELVWKRGWDVMVLDVTMPGRSGVEILREVRRARPKLPVLILSMHPEDQYALRVLEAGAAGYITKIKAPHELVDAISMVLAGGKYITPSIAGRLADKLRGGNQKPALERLSNREFEIMKLIGSGKSMKAIAHQLSVSAQTASTHRARILKKLGLQTTGQLIRYALENELVN